MEAKKEKLVYLCTHGPENPEKATLPVSMALGAMAMDMEAVVILQADGVLLAKKGVSSHVIPAGMTSFEEQFNFFLEDGGVVVACTACLSARKIGKEMLDERIELGSVARLAKECSEARNIVCY